MTLNVDLDILKDISIAEYTFMLLLYNNRREEAYKVSGIVDNHINKLIETNYLTSNIELTEKFIKNYLSGNLKEIAYSQKIDNFVEKYRNIFPSGSSSSGYPYRGSKQDCIKKMTKFKKAYPHFSEELILSVTRDYVNSHFFKAYAYMQTAGYLIEKNGTSNLAALCEQYKDKKRKDGNRSFEEDL